MLVLGFRTSPTEVRYAMLYIDGENVAFMNAESENRLKFPSNLVDSDNHMNNASEKLNWLHNEVDRILRQNPEVQKIVIKASEFGQREKISSRFSSFMEGVIVNVAGQRSVPIDIKTYASIGTRRTGVKAFAAGKAGQSQTGWNEQMADAVAAAWSGRR